MTTLMEKPLRSPDGPKLPTPLPYDVVDKWIDTTLYFFCDWWDHYPDRVSFVADPDEYPNNTYQLRCLPLQDEDGETTREIGNFTRELCEFINDNNKYHDHVEDAEGYVEYKGRSGMVWKAEWTEEDTEQYLSEYFDGVIYNGNVPQDSNAVPASP